MANKINNEIHIKSKQLTGLEKQAIYSCLERGMNLTDTSKYVKCDVSTIKKEIDRNKHLKTNQQFKNQCGLKLTCSKFNICGNTYCTHACNDCRYPSANCNNHCSEFTRFPKCKKLKHLCGVCNGCDSIQKCSLNKYLYDPIAAHANHVTNLKESHSGVRLSQNELKEFADFLIPFINHNISLCIIKSCYPHKFPYSIQSIYNWVDLRVLPGIDTFKHSFKLILTDRGVKFSNPKDIEFHSETGELLTRIFYCDSRQSQQKGKIEKNHEELRKICQKGFDFNTITQTKLNLALNHVNSYPRKFLNCKSPINLFKIYAPDIMLTLNDSKLIPIDKVNLKPNLFN